MLDAVRQTVERIVAGGVRDHGGADRDIVRIAHRIIRGTIGLDHGPRDSGFPGILQAVAVGVVPHAAAQRSGAELHQEHAVGDGGGQQVTAWAGVEIRGVPEGSRQVLPTVGHDRQAIADVVAGSAHAFCAQQDTRRIELGHKHVVHAGTGKMERPDSGIEVRRALERAAEVHAAVRSPRHRIRDVVAGAPHRVGPDKAAAGIELHQKGVRTAGAGEREGPRAGVEIATVGEVSRRVDRLVVGHRDGEAHVRAGASVSARRHKSAVRVQCPQEYIRAARAGQLVDPGAGVEVGGTLKRSRRVDGPVLGHGNAVADVVLSGAKTLDPHEIAGGIQFRNEHIRTAGACQRGPAEIGHAGELARGADAAIGAQRQAVRHVVVRPSPTPCPDRIAGGVQLPYEHVKAANAGQLVGRRSRREVRLFGEVAQDVHAAILADRHAFPGGDVPGFRRADPEQRPRRRVLGYEDVQRILG